ncbi:MAG: ABC transporter permease subunit [Clostridiales bacterium]|nr:ABC transporter permease subunit [Clostridiales bacterium]
MIAVFKRELISYFKSPVGYVVLAFFFFISGFMFVNQFSSGSINMASEIINLRSFFVIIVPVMTMGLFADDRKRGTDVLYYTSPVGLLNVVLGKFLAAFFLQFILFINVFVHMILTAACKGVIDSGTWGTVIVYFFLAALFISIGIFASSITDSQIVAAIVTFVGILLIQLISVFSTMVSKLFAAILMSSLFRMESEKAGVICSRIESAIRWFDPFSKTNDFSYGIFKVSSLLYCLSFAAFFIFLTYRKLEKKRWAKG